MAISCIVHTLISSPMAQIWILCSRGKNNISVTSERTVANCLCVPLINNTKTQENFKKTRHSWVLQTCFSSCLCHLQCVSFFFFDSGSSTEPPDPHSLLYPPQDPTVTSPYRSSLGLLWTPPLVQEAVRQNSSWNQDSTTGTQKHRCWRTTNTSCPGVVVVFCILSSFLKHKRNE